jgi:hypothetical protein
VDAIWTTASFGLPDLPIGLGSDGYARTLSAKRPGAGGRGDLVQAMAPGLIALHLRNQTGCKLGTGDLAAPFSARLFFLF